MSICTTSRLVSRTGLLACLLFSAPLVGAASHCKGMPENACASDSACAWVASYTRKDGRTVSGHCKLRRGKQAVNVSSARADAPTRVK